MRYCLILGALVLFLAPEIPVRAQYPPGGYPPGSPRTPGTGGIPGIPRRGKKKTKTVEDNQENFQYVTGIFRRLDDKVVIVEAQDSRIISLKRSVNTKFYKNEAEIKPEVLKPGDHLTVEATEDDDSYLYAVNVIFTKEGTENERAEASVPVDDKFVTGDEDAPPVLERKDSTPKVEDRTGSLSEHKSVKDATARAAAPKEPADEGEAPPYLRRGKQPGRKSSAPQEVTESHPLSADGTIPVPPPDRELKRETAAEAEAETTPAKPPDARIEKARAAAATFTESLPNYVCQQQVTRFISVTHNIDWQPMDLISAEVVFENNREHYRHIAIDGKHTKKKIEELPGAKSTGEFGTMLADLFSPSTAADFAEPRMSRIAGRTAYLYNFSVERDHSHWRVFMPSQFIMPAYNGSIWIDKETGRVMRIEMQANHVPEEFPLDKVETAVDYEFVRIGVREFLLPVHGETLTCERGTNRCSRNVIDFRNYHRYAGDASIEFAK